MEMMRCFWTEEDGLGTVEIVMLIAALLALALLFKEKVLLYAEQLMGAMFTIPQ